MTLLRHLSSLTFSTTANSISAPSLLSRSVYFRSRLQLSFLAITTACVPICRPPLLVTELIAVIIFLVKICLLWSLWDSTNFRSSRSPCPLVPDFQRLFNPSRLMVCDFYWLGDGQVSDHDCTTSIPFCITRT
ncbi:hypothetical protein FPV67DRAFT_1539477 [Lyophyllum atratum]|nr:hypothetical protein FPV67DRAFT_1539477 [Lyophyllum atratum]